MKTVARIIAGLLVGLLCAPSLDAAVAFGAGTSAGATTITTTVVTPTMTVSSGSNLVMIAVVRWEVAAGTATVSSVKWDAAGLNQSLTSCKAADSSGTRREQFFWVVPTVATAKTVTVTFSAATNGSQGLSVAYFTGAHQTNPCPSADIVSAAAPGGSANVTVTATNVVTGDMVMDGQGNNGVGSDVIGTNQVRIGTEFVNACCDTLNSSYKLGVSGGQMDWTIGGSGAVWLTGVVRIAQAAGAASPAPKLPLLGVGAVFAQWWSRLVAHDWRVG